VPVSAGKRERPARGEGKLDAHYCLAGTI
jgi:hypothetical protein